MIKKSASVGVEMGVVPRLGQTQEIKVLVSGLAFSINKKYNDRWASCLINVMMWGTMSHAHIVVIQCCSTILNSHLGPLLRGLFKRRQAAKITACYSFFAGCFQVLLYVHILTESQYSRLFS